LHSDSCLSSMTCQKEQQTSSNLSNLVQHSAGDHKLSIYCLPLQQPPDALLRLTCSAI